MPKEFYITTTLPYVNAELHMGHALEFIRADVIARYHSLIGEEVFFNSGTDEHGSKIFKNAQEKGMDVQAFVDMNVEKFHESVKLFGLMEGVHFIRTSDPSHVRAAQEFWKRVSDNGYIYKKNYQAKYCVGCESEKTDSELVDGKCPDHPNLTLELINEENYFFKYSAFGEKLLAFYKENADFIIPDFRFNEIKAFVERGLEDFSISRLKTKMPWGIEVPGDPDQVMYVWFDALVNYISTLGWPDDEEGKYKKFWEGGTKVQYCGKDNTRFQGAMWQAMLMAAGISNSSHIIVDGFITGEGGVKMSKTIGNVVDPKEIAREYGTDALRFFLLKEVSSFEDSPFTKERFLESYNAGLANGIGNLVSRVMTMAVDNNVLLSEFPSLEEILESDSTDGDARVITALKDFDLKKAMDLIWFRIQISDKLIQIKKPFSLVKAEDTKDEGLKSIKDSLIWLYQIAVLLEPFLPETSHEIQRLIKFNKKPDQPLFARK